MNVRYMGRKTVDSFGDKLARPLKPAAIITFSEAEVYEVNSILLGMDYDYHFFGESDFLWAQVDVDGKDDYKAFMKEWRAGKEAYHEQWKEWEEAYKR